MNADDLFRSGGPPGLKLLARQLTAVSQEQRLAILTLLSGSEPMTVTAVGEAVGLTQQNASHHLGILLGAELVETARSGREAYYRVRPDAIAEPPTRAYLGGWRLAGIDILLHAPPEPEPEPEPEPAPEPTPTPKKRRK